MQTNATAFLSVFCITLVLGLLSLGFQIYVTRRLAKEGQGMNRPVGKNSWITPLVIGWQKAEELKMTGVMTAWSAILILTWIGVFATVYYLILNKP